jgi:hypothetical protein
MTVIPTLGCVAVRQGEAVEVVGDATLAMPPLNPALANAVMASNPGDKALRGYRDRKPADLKAVAGALVKLSQLLPIPRRRRAGHQPRWRTATA